MSRVGASSSSNASRKSLTNAFALGGRVGFLQGALEHGVHRRHARLQL